MGVGASVPGALSPDEALDWLLPMPDGKPLNGADESGPASDVRAEPLPARSAGATVPVVDNGDRLVGIVSLGDIANRADYDDELQRAFEKISGRRSFWSRIWR